MVWNDFRKKLADPGSNTYRNSRSENTCAVVNFLIKFQAEDLQLH